MDETVLRAMQKWPNVPAVYGWLALDRRGKWLIKSKTGNFEPVTHPAMHDFIGRNYAHDSTGRWYLQNGPQRVFVAIEYTPWIYRLDDTGMRLCTHTGVAVQQPAALYLDEAGNLLVETELGIGVLLDRDLSALLEKIRGPHGEDAEAVIDSVGQNVTARCRIFGQELKMERVQSTDIPSRFRFNARPTPPPGQPDC